MARSFQARLKSGELQGKWNPALKRIDQPEYPVEVLRAVEMEWTAGIKTVTEVSREYGIPRQTIYAWSATHRWPDRKSVQEAARSAINSRLVENAVLAYRRTAPAEVRDYIDAQLRAANGNPTVALDAAKKVALIEDYAVVVAEIVQNHRELASDTLTLGKELLAIQKEGLAALKAKHATEPDALAKAAKEFNTQFAGLVRSLTQAVTMQREAFGMDGSTGSPDVPGEGQGEAQGAGTALPVGVQPGTYEDIVAEAERRGVSLAS